MSNSSYWQEAVELACGHAGIALTSEQAESIGEAISISHDNYGQAFYSPPSSDFADREEREWKRKYDTLKAEFDRYISNAEEAVRKKFRLRESDAVSIGEYGSVFTHGGRTTQLQ